MLDSSLTTTHILAAFDPDIGGLPGGTPWPNEPRSPRDPMMLASLRADFETLYAERYSVTGQGDVAKTQAIERLRFKWGATDIGSESSLMPYPPESYYPMVDGSHDWMDDQLTDFKDANEPDAQEWFLIPTEETERAVSASQPVPYAIGIIDKDGIFRVLSREDSARPRQFIFNYDEAREGALQRFEERRESSLPPPTDLEPAPTPEGYVRPFTPLPGPGPTLDPSDVAGGGMTGSGPTLP